MQLRPSFFGVLKPPSLPPTLAPSIFLAATKAAARPEPCCDSGSGVFTFKVAHPQQREFSLSFVLVFTPDFPRRGCKQENCCKFSAAAPRRRRRIRTRCGGGGGGVTFSVSEAVCSERPACLHTSTFLRLSLTRTPPARPGRGPRLSTLRTSAPRLPPQHTPNRFNIAAHSCEGGREKQKNKKGAVQLFPAPLVTWALLTPPTADRSFQSVCQGAGVRGPWGTAS